jgi:uncharacterized protein YjbJ (UPF0337 family)
MKGSKGAPRGESSMKQRRPLNWDQLEGAWKQRRGKAVQHWGRLMNDQLAAIAGKYEVLVGKLQEKYGDASNRSEHQSDDFKRIFQDLKRSNARLVRLQKRHGTRKPASTKVLHRKPPDGKPARRKAAPPPAGRKTRRRTKRA